MTEFTFLQTFDKDIRVSLLSQLRDLWTHSSTSLEGNTLTLGETKFVIEEGLTVSGKPLKDHQEVIGHSRAIDIIYQSLAQVASESDLFNLHKAIQSSNVSDIYKPQGAWKNESNGTYAVDAKGNQVFIEYASPSNVPKLMNEWLAELNNSSAGPLTQEQAIKIYAKLHIGFVHIHPFWDGNGRMARLLSNIPLLKSGHAPLVIQQSDRQKYIQLLADYQIDIGELTPTTGVWPSPGKLKEFENFCFASYSATNKLIENAKIQQTKRNSSV